MGTFGDMFGDLLRHVEATERHCDELKLIGSGGDKFEAYCDSHWTLALIWS